jgi:dipeptidyl aminopeptidase/acylaminoacyl peptidase
LNLIASVENISDANANQIFLWSHSMGGEVTLEVLEVAAKNNDFASKIKGAIFWAPVTDPVKWFSRNHLPTLIEARITPYPYSQTFQTLGTPEENPELWQSLSPINYLNDINVPILLQHGTGDTTVPYSWSVELNNDLLKLNKTVKFVSYPNDNHNLPLHWSEAVSEDLNFLQGLLNQ